MKQLIIAIELAAVLAIVGPSNAQAYNADARTSGTTTQLFSSVGTPSAVSNVIWFVADTLTNGVPTSPLAGSILGADDVLITNLYVGAGIGLGVKVGRLGPLTVTGISDVLSNAHIYAYLWNVPLGTTVGQVGQQFGVLDLGIQLPNLPNPATWTISSPIYGDTYSVIPEPSTIALVGFGLLGAWAIRRRKIS